MSSNLKKKVWFNLHYLQNYHTQVLQRFYSFNMYLNFDWCNKVYVYLNGLKNKTFSSIEYQQKHNWHNCRYGKILESMLSILLCDG